MKSTTLYDLPELYPHGSSALLALNTVTKNTVHPTVGTCYLKQTTRTLSRYIAATYERGGYAQLYSGSGHNCDVAYELWLEDAHKGLCKIGKVLPLKNTGIPNDVLYATSTLSNVPYRLHH